MWCAFSILKEEDFFWLETCHILYLGAEKIAPVFIQSTHMLVRDPFCDAKVRTSHIDQNFVLGSCSRIRIQCISWVIV